MSMFGLDFGELSKLAGTLDTGVRDIDSRLEQIANKIDLLIVATVISGLPMEYRDPNNIEDVLASANIYLLNHRDKMRRDESVVNTRPYDPTIDMAHPNGGGGESAS